MTTNRTDAANAIKSAHNLYQLLGALIAFETTVDRECEDQDHALAVYGLNIAELPSFGGGAPENTDGVWSWDQSKLLVGEGSFATWEIIDRAMVEG